MSRAISLRNQRIELRTKPEIKAIIERAAQLRNTTVSAYMLESALQKARTDLKDAETLLLNEEDRDTFFKALSAPPEPNDSLRGLFQDSRD